MMIDYLRDLETHINDLKKLNRESDAQNIEIEMLRSKVDALKTALANYEIPDEAVTYDKLAADFGSTDGAGTSSQISIASNADLQTTLVQYTIPKTGFYYIDCYINAYGIANSQAGFIDGWVAKTPTGTAVVYAARNCINVPALTDSTFANLKWGFFRSWTEGDIAYLRVTHNTGASRKFRGGMQFYRLK